MFEMKQEGKIFIEEFCKEFSKEIINSNEFKNLNKEDIILRKFDDNIFYLDRNLKYSFYIQHDLLTMKPKLSFTILKVWEEKRPYLGTGIISVSKNFDLEKIYDLDNFLYIDAHITLYQFIKDLKKFCAQKIRKLLKRYRNVN